MISMRVDTPPPTWKRGSAVLLAVALAALAGAAILGVGGRVVMRVIGQSRGLPREFSIGGTLEVIFAGTWRGVLGGLLYLGLDRFASRLRPPWRGPLAGMLVFLVSVIALPPELRTLIAELGATGLSVGLFGLLFLIYGGSLEALLGKRTRPG